MIANQIEGAFLKRMFGKIRKLWEEMRWKG